MALKKREKTSFMISIGVHVAAIAMMTYGLFSVPSLPEPPQGEISIDFDLSGGFNSMTLKKSPEDISKKPIEKTAGKVAAADVGQKEIVEKIAAAKKQKTDKLEEKKRDDAKREEKKRDDAKREEKKKLEAEKDAEEKKQKEKKKQEDRDNKKKLEAEERQELKKKELAEKKKRDDAKREEKKRADAKRKKALEDKKKKDLAEKKKKEADKKKKDLAEKKKAEKKRQEAAKKKKALLEKKKREEGKKKRFNDDRVANLLKSKDNNKATRQKSAGSGKDPVADILSKQASKNTGVAGKQGNKNATKAYKLGGGLGWSDKSKIINALRPCWERYQGVANGNVTVDFAIDGNGYLKGNVQYVSGDRSAFMGAKRAVPECASPIRGVNLDKISNLSDGLRVTFTPLDIKF